MIITNSTKNTLLSDDCKVADSFISRFIGLMGKDCFPQGSGLLIKPCNSIHMFFMKIPLDVIFVDKNNTVVHIIKEIKPWRISRFVNSACCVLEFPTGSINHSKTAVGDKLEFKYL